MLEVKIRNRLKEIQTPFGILYIEPFDMSRNARYREGYISIFDSRKNWIDNYSIEYFYDSYDPNLGVSEDRYAEAVYEDFCEMLKLGAEQKTLEGFLDWWCLDYDYAGPDKDKAEFVLSDGCPGLLLPNEIETNEYVCHIGDNYIVIRDY